jgi:hypothetical protein
MEWQEGGLRVGVGGGEVGCGLAGWGGRGF